MKTISSTTIGGQTRPVWFIFLALTVVIGTLVFLTQSQEKQLKKKTLKLIQLISSPPASESHIALGRKTQSIVKHVHFSVDYQVQIEGRSYQNRTLNRLRSDLFSYWKYRQKYKVNIKIPHKKDIKVSFSENKKKAEVKFKLSMSYKDKKVLSLVVINWEKEKSWLIYKVKATTE